MRLVALITLAILSSAAAGQACYQGYAYNPAEMAASGFFSNRELTKFPSGRAHYPLAQGASARYCLSRGCSRQLNVQWSQREIGYLQSLRQQLGADSSPQNEMRFVRVAVLQMEKWLRERALRSNPQRAFGSSNRLRDDGMAWIDSALSSYGSMDKECVTYTMEATQHLLVLANMGMVQHWKVKPPTYRFGIPGHWTATVQNRATCQVLRFDLNTNASARESLMARGFNPASMALNNPRNAYLFPGMDGQGYEYATAADYPAAPEIRPPPTSVSRARPSVYRSNPRPFRRRYEARPFNAEDFFREMALR